MAFYKAKDDLLQIRRRSFASQFTVNRRLNNHVSHQLPQSIWKKEKRAHFSCCAKLAKICLVGQLLTKNDCKARDFLRLKI